MPTAASAATSVNASRPTPAQRYQSRKPSTIAVTAASRAAGPRSASNTAAAPALRCTGPMVSWGRSGPQTVSGRRSIAVFPTCTSRAGPSGESCTGRAPTVMTCPNATTSRPGVSAIVVGMPTSRQKATSATVGHWRRAVRLLRRSYRAGPLLLVEPACPACAVRAVDGRGGGRRAIPGAPAPPAARRRRSRDPARTARRRRVRSRRPGGRAWPRCGPRAPGAAPARTAPCRAVALGDAVGVEQQRVAGLEPVGGDLDQHLRQQPDRRAVLPDLLDPPVRPGTTGRSWPARSSSTARPPEPSPSRRTSAVASVQNWRASAASIITSLSRCTASASPRPPRTSTRRTSRTSPVRAAARAPLPQTSPIETRSCPLSRVRTS